MLVPSPPSLPPRRTALQHVQSQPSTTGSDHDLPQHLACPAVKAALTFEDPQVQMGEDIANDSCVNCLWELEVIFRSELPGNKVVTGHD